jgi:AcrR family transcriptional regulator
VIRVQRNTRTKILNAAADLFRARGIRGSTLDAIAASASVTKKTIYNHFRSKDDLVAAILDLKDAAGNKEIDVIAVDERLPVSEMVSRLFHEVAVSARDPYWPGCAFTRAAFELVGMPGHPGVIAAKAHKTLLERKLSRALEASGKTDVVATARRLIILLEGAITQSVVYHDPQYALEAAKLALEIVDEAPDRISLKGLVPLGARRATAAA